MSDEQIEVMAYSGYKGEQSPRVFVLRNEKIEVIEILGSWVEEGLGNRTRKRFFKVQGSDGYRYKIYYDEIMKLWFLKKG
jgi:hypothetical protein